MCKFIRANAELLPQRIEKVMRDRIESGTYKTLAVGTVFGEKSEVVAFGNLDDGRLPDADTLLALVPDEINGIRSKSRGGRAALWIQAQLVSG